jgi:hypothetical protein
MRSATLSHSLPFLTLVLGRLTRMPSHQMQSRRRAFSFSLRQHAIFVYPHSQSSHFSICLLFPVPTLANYHCARRKWGKWVCVYALYSIGPIIAPTMADQATIKSKQMLMDEADIITIIASVFCLFSLISVCCSKSKCRFWKCAAREIY